jgi:para-nitrobenzyl esterase
MLSLLYPFSGSPVGNVAMDEDCLVLNIWTPARGSAPKPVMVWLHGGAFLQGASSEPTFWGDRLADRHDVVVVTVNHRLGALGYLPVPDADAGQAGMLDIVAALEWVSRNIHAFGGDPQNVTVFGQSGGGMKIATLMAMPTASGLFHKAIIQSGAGLWLPDAEQAAPLGDALFDALDLERGDIDALRDVPANAIVDAQTAAMAASGSALGFLPVRDGHHIIANPLSDELSSAPAVPLLIGSTREEAGMFLAMAPEFESWDEEMVLAAVRHDFADAADDVWNAYRLAFPRAEARGLLRRIISDRDFRVSERQFADLKAAASQSPVFGYLFDFPTGVLDGALGAAHSTELAFVFENTDRVPLSGTRPVRESVAAAMASCWTAFARTGDPSVAELIDWPKHRDGRRPTAVFSASGVQIEDDPDGERLELMSSFPSQMFRRADA